MRIFQAHVNLLISLVVCLLICSCEQKNEIDTSEFIITQDHKIELVAAEPDVILPVAIAEDEYNRLWVVEMPGYMRDIDGNDENVPDGRIVILDDTDQDGKIDSRKIFMDSLENPRALCFVNNGLLYSDGTQLKWTKIEGDHPNNTITVDSFYVVGGNIEHQPNALLYNLDNWIYSAKSNARYRYHEGKWHKEVTSFRGQWGMSMDKMGRLIYNHNSAPLIGDYAIPNQNLDNPFLKLNYSVGRYLTDDMSIYPIQATSVNRGYQPDVLDSTGRVINYTSACSPHLYYGNNLTSKFQNSAFVCAPEGNLIANYTYNENTLQSNRSLGKNEFLISKDESFRPVNLFTGFDGSLYIVDMRKGIIQHTAYMSSYLREKIILNGLDKINGKGRIYRIQKNEEVDPYPKTENLNSSELMHLFEHSNLQLRMFAQKKLIAKRESADYKPLYDIALNSDYIMARIHAIWTLEGLDQLTKKGINDICRSTADPDVLSQLIITSKPLIDEGASFQELYTKSFKLNSNSVDFLLSSIVGKSKTYEKIWFDLAKRYANNPLISESLISGISGNEGYYYSKIMASKNEILDSILLEVLTNKKKNEIQTPQLIEKPFDDDRTNGLKIYKSYCASCHGLDGKGQKNVAPSLKSSKIINENEKEIASIILNGYGPEKSIYKIAMPAYKEDPNLGDQDIVDLISYLKSTFTTGWSGLKIEDIQDLRMK